MKTDGAAKVSNCTRIGIDLGGTKIEAIALNSLGEERIRFRIPVPCQEYDATIRALKDIVEQIRQDLQAGSSSLKVGIGIPGSISPGTKKVQNSNSTWLNSKPFASDVRRAVNDPVRFANDADCFTISEATDGAGKGARTVFGVIIGTGLGGGFSVGKHLISGPRGTAGEWGHNPLPWPHDKEIIGPKCWCGRHGCLEAWVSGPALAKDFNARSNLDQDLQVRDIVNEAHSGDAIAQAVIADHHSRFARGLAHVINILDPDVIVLGGGLSAIPSLYKDLPKLIRPHLFTDTPDVTILPPKWGDSSGVRGAAWLWNEHEPHG